MSGRVVHVNDNVDGAVYIGRAMAKPRRKASPLANPFKIGQHGDRAEVIRLYTRFLHSEIQRGDPAVIAALIQARNKPLACWCRHDDEDQTDDNACHGDVILTVLDIFNDASLRTMAVPS